MSDVAIRVENLGKMYRIGGRQERYKRFTETVMDTLTAPIHRLRNLGKPAPPEETLWALKDVSFEIKHGEAVGIIGRNGAGKSTLLKILSRITEPTTGRVELHGRVGSLLEVGTGFHPELTGRENIYLNGAILGMRRAEINRKFDEIVAFSGVEQFLDTPVKRYSSGMHVRLAFAVAAHLEPEILLVDEVLAVGDAEFQKKCLGKMGEVASGGRTVLFVSHNMGAVDRLCPRSILLSDGKKVLDGPSETAVSTYLNSVTSSSTRRVHIRDIPDLPISFREVALISADKTDGEVLEVRDQLYVEITYVAKEDLRGTNIGFTLKSGGVTLFRSWDCDLNSELLRLRKAGQYVARIPLPHRLLAPGTYSLSVAAGYLGVSVISKHEECLVFDLSNLHDDMTHTSFSRGALLMIALPWDIRRA